MLCWIVVAILSVVSLILLFWFIRAWSRRMAFFLIYGLAAAFLAGSEGYVKFDCGKWSGQLGGQGLGVGQIVIALSAIAGIVLLESRVFPRFAKEPAQIISEIRRALDPNLNLGRRQLARELGLTEGEVNDCVHQLLLAHEQPMRPPS